jgi:hypothetical protein
LTATDWPLTIILSGWPDRVGYAHPKTHGISLAPAGPGENDNCREWEVIVEDFIEKGYI